MATNDKDDKAKEAPTRRTPLETRAERRTVDTSSTTGRTPTAVRRVEAAEQPEQGQSKKSAEVPDVDAPKAAGTTTRKADDGHTGTPTRNAQPTESNAKAKSDAQTDEEAVAEAEKLAGVTEQGKPENAPVGADARTMGSNTPESVDQTKTRTAGTTSNKQIIEPERQDAGRVADQASGKVVEAEEVTEEGDIIPDQDFETQNNGGEQVGPVDKIAGEDGVVGGKATKKYIVHRADIFIAREDGDGIVATQKVPVGKPVALTAAEAKYFNEQECLAPFIEDDEDDENE